MKNIYLLLIALFIGIVYSFEPVFHIDSDLHNLINEGEQIPDQVKHLFSSIFSWSSMKAGEDIPTLSEIDGIDGLILSGDSISSNQEIITQYLMNPKEFKPILFVNINSEQKRVICDVVKACYKGNSHAFTVSPFLDENQFLQHRIQHWGVDSTGLDTEQVYVSDADISTIAGLYSEDLKTLVMKGGDLGSGDSGSMIPQNPLSVYRVVLGSIYGSFTASLAPYKPDSQQSIQHRIDNTYYNYRVNGSVSGIDGSFNGRMIVLTQDGIISPSSQISTGGSAVGFFQWAFNVSNSPTFNVSYSPSEMFWVASNPVTVNQEITTQSTVTNSISLDIDISLNSEGGGGSAGFSESQEISNSVTSEITAWGIDETTQPISGTTQWIYHQQYPYDVYNLGYDNFGVWYKDAYSGNNVATPPDLSMNTLQLQTTSAWFISDSIQQRGGDILTIDHERIHQVGYVCEPNVLNSHHLLVVNGEEYLDIFEMDVTSYPSSTAN